MARRYLQALDVCIAFVCKHAGARSFVVVLIVKTDYPNVRASAYTCVELASKTFQRPTRAYLHIASNANFAVLCRIAEDRACACVCFPMFMPSMLLSGVFLAGLRKRHNNISHARLPSTSLVSSSALLTFSSVRSKGGSALAWSSGVPLCRSAGGPRSL